MTLIHVFLGVILILVGVMTATGLYQWLRPKYRIVVGIYNDGETEKQGWILQHLSDDNFWHNVYTTQDKREIQKVASDAVKAWKSPQQFCLDKSKALVVKLKNISN